MNLRSGLFAATFLLVPFEVEAQTLGYPASGLYIGAAGGFNIKANPSVKNLSSSLTPGTGISTPNMNLSTGIGAAAAGTIGYGLGTGCASKSSIAMRATRSRGPAAIIATD